MAAASNTSPETWTIRRVLDWTRTYLSDHGSPSPRLDAEILLAYSCGCPRIQLYTHFDDVLSGEVRGRMRDLVKRRARHEPVAYLVGHREFFSLNFQVNRDVLIPRPETEILVLETLDVIKKVGSARVLELGTGSGCIAVSIAVNARNASVTATDISEAAIAVAERNAQLHQVTERITFHCGDLLAPVAACEPFDVIVSNPPYVAEEDAESLPPDVRCHEPGTALFAGIDGLDVIRRIMVESPQLLKPGGRLFIEFSTEQAKAIEKLASESRHFDDITILRDLSQNPRAMRATRTNEFL